MKRTSLLSILTALLWAGTAVAEDAFYQVKLADLAFTDGALPKEATPGGPRPALPG